MKIIREGDHVFVIGKAQAYGFNLKQISRVEVEDGEAVYGLPAGEVFLAICTGDKCSSMQITRDEARRLFQDTPWVLLLKEFK